MKQNSTLRYIVDNYSEGSNLTNVNDVLNFGNGPEFKEVYKYLDSYKRTVREEVVQKVFDYARSLQK